MTRNLLVDNFRRTRNQRATDSLDDGWDQAEELKPVDRLAATGPTPHESAARNELAKMVQKALARVSGRVARGSDSDGICKTLITKRLHRFWAFPKEPSSLASAAAGRNWRGCWNVTTGGDVAMAERTHIPSSPACGEWETLLADALDGLLKPEDEAKFTAHKAVCPACAALYEEARQGARVAGVSLSRAGGAGWAAGKDSRQDGPGPRGGSPAGQWVLRCLRPAGSSSNPSVCAAGLAAAGIFRHGLRNAVQPSLLMTAAMAFFSIALTLNLAGVRLTSLQLADLRPRAVRSYMERQLTMASVPIVRYYDHLRFVYEVESRVRELRGRPTAGKRRAATQRNAARRARRDASESGAESRPQRRRIARGPSTRPGHPAVEPVGDPASDFVDASLRLQNKTLTPLTAFRRWGHGSVQSGGSALRAWERSRVWIA